MASARAGRIPIARAPAEKSAGAARPPTKACLRKPGAMDRQARGFPLVSASRRNFRGEAVVKLSLLALRSSTFDLRPSAEDRRSKIEDRHFGAHNEVGPGEAGSECGTVS